MGGLGVFALVLVGKDFGEPPWTFLFLLLALLGLLVERTGEERASGIMILGSSAIAFLVQVWFFATPIIYPWFQPNVQRFRTLFNMNLFTHLAVCYQEILFFPGPIGHWRWLLALGAYSIVQFLAAYWLFDRLRDSFAEVV